MMSTSTTAQYKLNTNSNAITIIPTTDTNSPAAALASIALSSSTPPPLAAVSSVAAAAAAAAAASGDRIEWSRATILDFIEDYRRQRVLWDPNTKGYHIKQTKYEALKTLSHKYGTEIRSIRSKIKSLRSSFHREHGKVVNGRSRGVHYQPMWFAYEAIRFILDGERASSEETSCMTAAPSIDSELCSNGDGEEASVGQPEEKLALLHSLDLEHLMLTGGVRANAAQQVQEPQQQQLKQQQQEEQDHSINAAMEASEQQQQQHEEIAARVAAAVAAVAAAAAAAAASHQQNFDEQAQQQHHRHHNHQHQQQQQQHSQHQVVAMAGSVRAEDGVGVNAAAAAAVARSDLLDGENYCNISAEDVKTEIIEADATELNMIEGRITTPSPLNCYKPTDLTYNRKRRVRMEDDAYPLAKQLNQQQQAQQQLTAFNLNHNALTLQSHHALQQLQLNHSQQQQQQQQQQLQHSNMAQKRDHDLSHSSTNHNHNNSNSNNNNNNSSSNNVASPSNATTLSSLSGSSSTTTLLNANNTNAKLSANHVDEYGVFGEYVAITIRKLKTSKAKIVVKHLINNLLYEAELGKYDHGIPASKEPPQLYKMQ